MLTVPPRDQKRKPTGQLSVPYGRRPENGTFKSVPDLHMGKLGNCPGPGELGGPGQRHDAARVMSLLLRCCNISGATIPLGPQAAWVNIGFVPGLSRPPILQAPDK